METRNETDILNGLNPAQRQAAAHINGPLLIVAGAGAGKTRTLTHRIAHLIHNHIKPQNILAITFTNKAAAELRERLLALLAQPDNRQTELPLALTFHALGVRILRTHAEKLGIKKHFTILDRADQEQIVRRIMKELDYDTKQWSPSKVVQYLGNRHTGRTGKIETLEPIYNRFQIIKKERHALDFEDLLVKPLELLRENKDVRAEYQNIWKYIHVDEYQDTDKVQYELIRLLVGDECNICVVGDTDQTIYTWRGAEIKNLLRFEKDFPGTTTVLLEENYRSSANIINLANEIIAKNNLRIDKNLFTKNEAGAKAKVTVGQTDIDEAYLVSQEIDELINQGVKPNNIAILYRNNFQSQPLEKALVSKQIAYDLLGTKFYERKEIKDMLAYIRFAFNPDSIHDLMRIAGVPKRGIGEKTLQMIIAGKVDELGAGPQTKARDFLDFLDLVKRKINKEPLAKVMEYILSASGWAESLKKEDDGEERLSNLSELINTADDYDENYPAPQAAEKLLEEAALMSDQDELAEKAPAIKMMTIHASKGLEFDYVFITGLEQGLFPSERGDDATQDNEEERRLFYVAVTRAKKRAFLSWAQSRRRFGTTVFNLPSEFLTEINPDYIEQENNLGGSSSYKRSFGSGLLDDIEF